MRRGAGALACGFAHRPRCVFQNAAARTPVLQRRRQDAPDSAAFGDLGLPPLVGELNCIRSNEKAFYYNRNLGLGDY